ncbi:beta-lysine acetyltransferase [Desulfocucumis palustris]|uniref:Beta-lysine acetyltransferase n=1 Tax=Desulfocucumis palustris TaxID=1898651 RepID=A0A2L2XEC0_9FIRM|nr:putative beta-lysine N-acetyltransferase [Desulfocucumis palustris]GBF34697.1 beta-lysine acetyltransferase [Desulfocucumis palustris]
MYSQQQVCHAGPMGTEKILEEDFQIEIGLDFANQRLKVLSYQAGDYFLLAERIKELAREKKLGKVLFNSRKEGCPELERAGFVPEGTIPGFFNGKDACCYSYFIDSARFRSRHLEEEDGILKEVTGNKAPVKSGVKLPSGYNLREIREDDVEGLVSLYRNIFASYPSPLFNPGYILDVMRQRVYFLAVFKNNVPVSAGSAEMDLINRNAEITDLATHPGARGMGLVTAIMKALETEMRERKLNCLYSLSRAGVPGVNRALYKLGYSYKGRLINNCHIGGRFEDMNIWVKSSHCAN